MAGHDTNGVRDFTQPSLIILCFCFFFFLHKVTMVKRSSKGGACVWRWSVLVWVALNEEVMRGRFRDRV